MLEKLTNWLKELVLAIWQAFSDFMSDLLLKALELWLVSVTLMWSKVPMPDFLDGYSLCSLISQAGPTVGWAMNTFRIGEGLGLLAAGFAFRMVRKLATLFQW